jgi:hypothetical protein
MPESPHFTPRDGNEKATAPIPSRAGLPAKSRSAMTVLHTDEGW